MLPEEQPPCDAAVIDMFTAYFDASGNKKDKVLTLAGFVSHRERWQRFEGSWKALLPPGVQMFHMTDFASSKNGWENWKGASKRRAEFFDSLISCIGGHTNQGFAVSLQIPDFERIDAEYRFHEHFGQPYTFVARACVAMVRKWADKKLISWRKILYVLEDGDEGQGEAILRLRDEGYNIIPQSKTNNRAFDTCDLAAWKARRIVEDAVYQNKMTDKSGADKIWRSLDQLEIVVRDKGVGHYSIKALTHLCNDHKIQKR